MKILLLADLHGQWNEWLAAQASATEIIVVAGDILDLEEAGGTLNQILRFDRCISAIRATGTNIVFTSGNHDMFTTGNAAITPSQRLSEILAHENWWDAMSAPAAGCGAVVTPGQASVISGAAGEKIVVSAHPYQVEPNSGIDSPIWRAAARLRRANQCAWLALHHVPPSGSAVGECQRRKDDELRDHIEHWRPNCLASGHLHDRPFEKSGSWHDRLAESIHCFNPGARPQAPVPNHIVIDSTDGSAAFRGNHGIQGRPHVIDSRSLW